MPPLDLGKFAPVTLGHMRSQGCRELLAYCKSGRCKHSAIMDVGHLPNDTPIKSLGDGLVCSRCGHVGADVLPNWRAQIRYRRCGISCVVSSVGTVETRTLS